MTPIRVWLRAVLRQRWRATVLLSLLIGIAGAAALGAADGARRTQTAFPRMREETKAADLLVSVGGTGLGKFYDAVARLPGVERIGTMAGIPLALIDASGKPDIGISPVPNAAADERMFFTVHRPKIIAGRMFDPTASDEAILDPQAARRGHWHVGSVLPMFLFTGGEGSSAGVKVSIRVVGIGIIPEAVVPTTPLDEQPVLTLSPAFFRAQPSLASRQNLNYDGAFVRLRRGSDIQAFEKDVDALAQTFPDTFGTFNQNLAQTAEREQRAIVPLAIALYAFAALIGIAMLFVLGQAIARQQFVEADDYATLRALGFTRIQVTAVSLIRVSLIVVSGGLIAAVGALAVSPFMPIGPARLAELHPGFEVNVGVIALGALAIVLLMLLRAVPPAIRLGRGSAGSGAVARRSVLAEAAARSGLPPTATAGVRMAFEQQRGSRSLPLRSALAGSIVGLAALTAALMFGSTLNRLVTVPSAYGQRWDVIADSQFGIIPLRAHAADLDSDPNIAGFTAGNYGSVVIGNRDVPAIGLDMMKGTVYPALEGREGRPATKPDEIVLGTTVMRRLKTAIGRTIDVILPGKTKATSMTVVGRAVFPTLGRGSFAPTSLGDGAALTASAFAELNTGFNPGADEPYNFILFKLSRGADRASTIAGLKDRFENPECAATNDCFVGPGQRPIELKVLTRVRAVPLILAGLLALFAAATLAHALLTSVRIRSRDLAVLKTLGFVRRQIRATVAWQTSTLAFTALLLGLPLGVIAGRSIWSVFASGLGVPADTVISLAAIVVVIPATLLLANVIGTLPARAAARTEAAVVLRTE